jgi:CRP-like cAMP-binding protein
MIRGVLKVTRQKFAARTAERIEGDSPAAQIGLEKHSKDLEKKRMMCGAKQDFSYVDPLMYLPRKAVCQLPRGRVIYDRENLPINLYLVISGRVKVSILAGEGRRGVARIVRAEGLFGETCLVGRADHDESAGALDNVTLMCWDRAEIEERIEQEPRLGIALSQYMVRQGLELQDRIEAIAVHKTPERVILGLLQLATDLGNATEDGSTRCAHLTHETIADFVGTSREIVSYQLSRLRRLGLIRYSRQHLDIDAQAMIDTLRGPRASIPRGAEAQAPPTFANIS